MHAAGGLSIEEVLDARTEQPTDAVIRITRACIRGSDRWPYKSIDPAEDARMMGPEAIRLVKELGSEVSRVKKGDLCVMSVLAKSRSAADPSPVRAYTNLLPDIIEGDRGRPVLQPDLDLDGSPDGHRAINERDPLKVMVRP